VDETAEQARFARETYGRSSVRRLADLGVLGPHVSCAHGVWLDAEDIALLAAAGARVVHNPVANLRLGSGRAPVAALRRAGVVVALGTDGAASNDSLDLLESAKTALLLSRLGPREEWLGPRDVLEMATSAGRVLLGGAVAAVAPGMPADLAAFELDAPPLVPLHDPGAQLVLGGPAVRARHAFVAGRWVLRDGRLPGIDEERAYARGRSGEMVAT
jgi:guanine deaminase